jgi:hypothetical protein
MKRFYKFVGLTALLYLVASCGPKKNDSGGSAGDGSSDPLAGNPIAEACGFVCPGGTLNGAKLEGIADGNASISGVTEVDSFFAATLNFSSVAGGVSGGIQAQLDAIKADFGIDGDLAAGLKAQFAANLDGSLDIEYEPAQCVVDAHATFEASALCDATVAGGKATVDCKGTCEADVTADVTCDANAELRCTLTAPNIACSGECKGTCQADVAASGTCGGSCKGSCDGDCTAYVKNTKGELECSGQCSGKCTGTCELELTAEAKCEGMCTGECTTTKPSGGCEGGVRAECRATGDASFSCSGRCTGDFEPPKVKAECEATAKAQASVNVECSPPHLAVNYKLKANVDAQFDAALKSLVSVRLPALLQAARKGNLVAQAGDDLGVAATGAVKSAVDVALKGKATYKILNGLRCAGIELPKAKTIVTNAADDLTDKLTACQAVSDAIGIKS